MMTHLVNGSLTCKWLSVKENHYIQAFSKMSFASCRNESMFLLLLYSIESMPLLSIR